MCNPPTRHTLYLQIIIQRFLSMGGWGFELHHAFCESVFFRVWSQFLTVSSRVYWQGPHKNCSLDFHSAKTRSEQSLVSESQNNFERKKKYIYIYLVSSSLTQG